MVVKATSMRLIGYKLGKDGLYRKHATFVKTGNRIMTVMLVRGKDGELLGSRTVKTMD